MTTNRPKQASLFSETNPTTRRPARKKHLRELAKASPEQIAEAMRRLKRYLARGGKLH